MLLSQLDMLLSQLDMLLSQLDMLLSQLDMLPAATSGDEEECVACGNAICPSGEMDVRTKAFPCQGRWHGVRRDG